MKRVIFSIMVLLCTANVYAEEIDRHNVPDELANPKRVMADNLFYIKLGYGGVFGDYKGYGSSMGFGYRHEMDEMAVDFGFLNYVMPESDDDENVFNFNLIQIQGLRFFNPLDNSSFYAGGGLAYNIMGSTHDADYDEEDSGTYMVQGIAAVATIGIETMRTSTIRFFCQLEATLPFGKMKSDERNDSYYGSSVSFTLGIGY